LRDKVIEKIRVECNFLPLKFAILIYLSYLCANKLKLIRDMYLLNAFSLQMINEFPTNVKFEEVDTIPNGLVSAIGHQDTANVLGVPMNRVNVSLSKGDVAYIAQLQGGRLPEGATTLPNGFTFKFIKVSIE
jgi:hypothetical protein